MRLDKFLVNFAVTAVATLITLWAITNLLPRVGLTKLVTSAGLNPQA